MTNGLGGSASGTIAGAVSRRYHALLLAAMRPPLGRTLLVAKLDETVDVAGRQYRLSTNVWAAGVEAAAGCRWLHRFDLILGVPTWCYELPAGADERETGECTRLIKRIWMEPGRNITYVQYELDECSQTLTLNGTLLVNTRDYHVLRHHQDCAFESNPIPGGLRLRSTEGGPTIDVTCRGHAASSAEWTPDHTWYRDFRLLVEEARGYDYLEDHFCAGHCRVELQPGQTVTFVLSAEPDADVNDTTALIRRQNAALERWTTFEHQSADENRTVPPAVRQLVLAADQFIVSRKNTTSETETEGYTVIAGYPWFTDWGRDTMIALPGLTLCTGRFDVARLILRTWSGYVSRGMIPNRFPDQGDTPEYHTCDGTLWYLWAIDQYARVTGDHDTLATLFPIMNEIVDWHLRGTRHNIRVGDDGLVYAGEEGVNLTWMDAKYRDHVITPRIGKAIELSALWYDALHNMTRLAHWLGKPADRYERLAERTRASFARFWNPQRDCCYDVLDGPQGNDASLRPNQVFAVSLEHSPLSPQQRRSVVDACQRELLTWFGLRTLGPREPGYRGRYAGDLETRDQAYHQGTSWGWLLGPFVIAHFRVYQDAGQARRFLEPLLGQLWTHCVGSLSEVFDGDEPHEPKACVAQAWSVAETLRAWQITQGDFLP